MTRSVTRLTAWIRRSGLISLSLLVLAVFSFRSAVADWNDVPTGSMRPTILIGDRIVVNKLAYDLKIPFTRTALATWDDPARGDVVTCWSPADGNRLVKRVVGVPGDTLAMRQGRLIVNGRPLPYTAAEAPEGERKPGRSFFTENLVGVEHTVAYDEGRHPARDFGPIRVPEGQYFLMGDNRDNSADSRYFGFVERRAICGKVTGLALSLDREDHWKPRWGRFFASLD